VSDFPFLHRTNLRRSQCRHSYRLPVKRQKLHLERFAFVIDVYHRTHIARFQTLLWNAPKSGTLSPAEKVPFFLLPRLAFPPTRVIISYDSKAADRD